MIRALKNLTFIEIFICLIVVVCVGIFVAPIFASGHPAPYRTPGLSQVKQSSLGVLLYSSDYDDLFPYVRTPSQLVEVTCPYTKSRDAWKTFNPGKPGIFVYNPSLPGASLADLKSPETIPMVLDPYGRRGRNESDGWFFITSFVDGHAKSVRESDWAPFKAKLSLKLKRYGKPLE